MTLESFYGALLLVRPPVPVTLNEAGVNYKSEVPHARYSPREAYEEWLTICERIVDCGGDAIFSFEDDDERFLDRGDLRVDAGGRILAASGEALGHTSELFTGRVFTANGPWVRVDGRRLAALLPRLVAHRAGELGYYERLLGEIAALAGLELALEPCPYPWEGLADVAPVGDLVVLTYTAPGRYDEGVGRKTLRSSREGLAHAADFARVPEERRVYADLRYPHFHGDTVHFGVRPAQGSPRLAQYTGGLYGDGARRVAEALGAPGVVPIDRDDAVEHYAANSRQVGSGVLVPGGVSARFAASLEALGLATHRVPLAELFGKAGGGPACATLYLPADLEIPPDAPCRYSVRREEARARRERIAGTLCVDPAYFAGRRRG